MTDSKEYVSSIHLRDITLEFHRFPYRFPCFQFVIKESSKLPSLTRALTLPTLEALTVLLLQGEAQISNPHNVIVVLGALQFVPLDSHSMEDYHAAFEAIHEALFAIIHCYPQVSILRLEGERDKSLNLIKPRHFIALFPS